MGLSARLHFSKDYPEKRHCQTPILWVNVMYQVLAERGAAGLLDVKEHHDGVASNFEVKVIMVNVPVFDEVEWGRVLHV